MPTIDELRARAREHEDEIESVQWFTIDELAKRWRISAATVRTISFDELKFKEFGKGEKKKRRRFRSDWVAAYEGATGRSAA